MWTLHWLDIFDKHNRIATTAAATTQITAMVGVPGMFVGPDGDFRLLGPGPGGRPLMSPAGTPSTFSRQLLMDDYTEVHRSPAGFNEDIQVAIGVAFAEPEIVQGQPVVETLRDLIKLAEYTIGVLERRGL
jgi:hypothetical protein